MKMLFPLFLIAVVGFICSGCALASESKIQTAIAETQFAAATNTPTPHSTQTPTPKPTHTPPISPSPSSTPDIRIILGEPRDFQLKPEDLPLDGRYYLPNSGWTSPHLNSEVISGWTVEKGKAYLADTGRITGWYSAYARGTRTVQMPDEVHCNVIKYRSHEGAQKVVLIYTRQSRYPLEGWKSPDLTLDLGDVNFIEYKEKITSGGDKYITYYIDFSYRNFAVICYAYGRDTDVSHEFVENVARKMLNKLKSAELGYPPTITPTITEVPNK